MPGLSATSSRPAVTGWELRVSPSTRHLSPQLTRCLILYHLIAFYTNTDLIKAGEENPKPGTLIVAVTSDRGLCGGVHSAVAKKIRAIMKTDPNAQNIRIVCIGDKSKAMLARYVIIIVTNCRFVGAIEYLLVPLSDWCTVPADNSRRIY